MFKESKEEVFKILKDSKCLDDYMKLLQDIYEYKECVNNVLNVNNQALQTMHQSLEALYSSEKDVQSSDQLMVSDCDIDYIQVSFHSSPSYVFQEQKYWQTIKCIFFVTSFS